MKTSKILLFAAFVFLFATLFSCSQSEDPEPTTPNEPTSNLPTGLPGGGGDTGNPPTPQGGDQKPGDSPSTEALGLIVTPSARYEFPEFLGAEAQSQPNDADAYPIDYYYGDEDAANDNDGDDRIDGVLTLIRFNAAMAGKVQPGQYAYQPGSEDANAFSYIFLMDHDRTFLLSEASIQIATTSSDEVYGVVFEGQGVEIEIVDEQAQIISEPFEMNGQFLIPPSVSAGQGFGARRAFPLNDIALPF